VTADPELYHITLSNGMSSYQPRSRTGEADIAKTRAWLEKGGAWGSWRIEHVPPPAGLHTWHLHDGDHPVLTCLLCTDWQAANEALLGMEAMSGRTGLEMPPQVPWLASTVTLPIEVTRRNPIQAATDVRLALDIAVAVAWALLE